LRVGNRPRRRKGMRVHGALRRCVKSSAKVMEDGGEA
jgi:hypothetical protein